MLGLQLRCATGRGYVCIRTTPHFESGERLMILNLVHTLIKNGHLPRCHLTGCLEVIRIRAGRGGGSDAVHKS